MSRSIRTIGSRQALRCFTRPAVLVSEIHPQDDQKTTQRGLRSHQPPSAMLRVVSPAPCIDLWVTLQTLKIATGATAPVASLQIRRLHSEPASSLQGLSRWAGGRSFGDRPPAQRESCNDPCGHLTAGWC
ncbi:hypothetical protein NDU88_000701 [Pleurodeles waltl]|uniref:Uncharacterized protein n=1 Tax=Pleurodeles waltl TaxID=8319 RepID=A0AAV7P1K9_PLEWA|nr:hypothetical protein NDU88_000701 [Pleurodeles waltl]